MEVKHVKAIIVPHAGYYYSGPTAAWAYQYLAQCKEQIKNIFIFGPSHHKYFPGCTLTYMDQYNTPMGPLDINIDSTIFSKIVIDELKNQ